MYNLNVEYTKAKQKLFDKVYSERLNPEQARAVFTAKGPLLVLAGAGSGKTTVLVNRIAYLIRYGNAYFSEYVPDTVTEETVEALNALADSSVEEIEAILPEFITEPCPPWSILAITFTNKAAAEIRERLLRTFDDRSVTDSIWAGTFHSICLRILRKYGDRLGYKSGFSIYDADDSKRMITGCMKELDIDEKRLSPRAVANLISRAKDSLKKPSDMEGDDSFDPRMRDVCRIYELYCERMMANNALDFDDIIVKSVELLKNDEEVREYYQNKFRHVLVDEYQDTNYAQFVLTSLLAGKWRNIMVVGDDDQSIYRFRGATVENILNFDKTYPDATVVKLEQNYRSTETILEAANAIIHNNGKRHDKRLWSSRGIGEKITLREAADQNEEGRYIIEKINQRVRAGSARYSDFAILYRVNELARSLETTFAKSGVPYRILGGTRFYDRKEIKDIIAYLTLICSRDDSLRLKRIINEPKRKIGNATVEAIESISESEGLPMFEVMRRAENYVALDKSRDKLLNFVDMIDRLAEGDKLPSALIEEVFDKTGYREMLVAEGFEGEGKIDNINELIAGALEYEKRCAEAETYPSLAGYLEDIALVSDIDKYDTEADAVVMMTVHSAKGLEFPIVFLAGMEDGIFPSEQNMQSEDEMSEERRLAYVAITRAKEKLYITYAKNRMMYGKTAYNMLSSFIRREMPKSLAEYDMPRREPPRMPPTDYVPRRDYPRGGGEISRTVNMFSNKPKATSATYGIEKLPVGCAVSHAMFGDGVILSAKEMGGDILYEVDFATSGRKKLMATFAKLVKK